MKYGAVNIIEMWVGAYPFCILPLDSKIQHIACTLSCSNKVFQIKMPHSPTSGAECCETKRQLERGKPTRKCKDIKICEPGECRFAREQNTVRKRKKKKKDLALWQNAYLRQKRTVIKEWENFAVTINYKWVWENVWGTAVYENKPWQKCTALFYFRLSFAVSSTIYYR